MRFLRGSLVQNDKANSAHARKTQANPQGNGRPAVETARESEKTGGRKKSGNRKGERKRLNGIYKKKKVEVKELTKQKRQKKEEDEILR